MDSILIIDDDPWIRSLLGHLCQKMGYAAIFASDGDRGLNTLEDNPQVKLVILDMQMPNLNGLHVAKAVRQDTKYDDLPIIMVSGFVQAHEVSDILRAGVNRFVPKPIDNDQLRQYISDMMEQACAAKAG
ncbi:MAG: response regulator [Phycisphaeraceae bacterium JB051]